MDHERLRAIEVFSTLGEGHLRSLAALMGESSVPRGAAIVKQGEHSHDFFAIAEGRADVLRDGKRVATLDAGECFGEIGTLDRRPRTATVVATTPMRLLTLTRWDLERVGADLLLAIRDQLRQRLVVHVE
jgi:CRP-like cAMP-binding protein